MKERPILFSGPMIRLILEGRKTQTRRVAKLNIAGRLGRLSSQYHPENPGAIAACPYGQPGDRLWVRETWNICFRDQLAPGEEFGKSKADCIRDNHGFGAPCAHGVVYAATSPSEHPEFGKAVWRPSIHMPRWASRILLEIVAVRVERVQAIDDGDALEEGIFTVDIGSGYSPRFSAFSNSWQEIVESQVIGRDWPRDAFRDLWDAINALRGFGWNTNPWVWAITFKRVELSA